MNKKTWDVGNLVWFPRETATGYYLITEVRPDDLRKANYLNAERVISRGVNLYINDYVSEKSELYSEAFAEGES